MGSRIMQARDVDVHVVSEDFVQAVLDGETPLSAIRKKCISSWGGDVTMIQHFYSERQLVQVFYMHNESVFLLDLGK